MGKWGAVLEDGVVLELYDTNCDFWRRLALCNVQWCAAGAAQLMFTSSLPFR